MRLSGSLLAIGWKIMRIRKRYEASKFNSIRKLRNRYLQMKGTLQ